MTRYIFKLSIPHELVEDTVGVNVKFTDKERLDELALEMCIALAESEGVEDVEDEDCVFSYELLGD